MFRHQVIPSPATRMARSVFLLAKSRASADILRASVMLHLRKAQFRSVFFASRVPRAHQPARRRPHWLANGWSARRFPENFESADVTERRREFLVRTGREREGTF